jgi:pSer/pThr/pTyr-binding forkhead associated (FHA) protein
MNAQMQIRFYLTNLTENKKYELEDNKTYSIGRNHRNDIQISNKCLAVSRLHGEINIIDGNIFYNNLSSNTNSTFRTVEYIGDGSSWSEIPRGVTTEVLHNDHLRLGGDKSKRRFGKVIGDICDIKIERITERVIDQKKDDENLDLPTPTTLVNK